MVYRPDGDAIGLSSEERAGSVSAYRVLLVAATLASAALLFLGTGLHPHPWLTWWMPLPLLLLSGRVPSRALVAGAVVAGMLGGSNLWIYATQSLGLPAPTVVGYLLAEGLLLGLVVVLFHRLLVDGHPVLAAAVAPAAWVVGEWAGATFSPNGAFLSIAYTQADWHRVLGVVPATGIWGLSYLIVAVPAGIAAIVATRADRRATLCIAGWLAAVIAVAGGYGTWYDMSNAGVSAATVDAAAIVVGQPYDPVDIDTAAGRELLLDFTSAITRAAVAHPALIVLPEKAFRVTGATRGLLVDAMRSLARTEHVVIVAGSVVDDRSTGGDLSNVAAAYPASGGKPVTYRKIHLIPSYESDFTPGRALVRLRGSDGGWGLEVCKDLDFPGLSRAYARSGVGLLAVPAWDFDRDAWLHARIAVANGAATGITIVRTARNGALTISDPTGQVVAEARTGSADRVQTHGVVAVGTHDTIYDHWGDWFAWLCAALVLFGIASVFSAGWRARRERPTRREGD